jgi:hypothetical protein
MYRVHDQPERSFRIMNRKIIAVLFLLASSLGFSQPDEHASASIQSVPSIVDQPNGTLLPQPGEIFAGTSLNGPGGNNDFSLIDPITNTSRIFAAGVPIWGATYDPASNRVLYTTQAGNDSTVDGAPLYAVSVDSGVTTLLGVIRDGAGADFRIDGLALSNGVLYGSRAAAAGDGLYSIDLSTLTATLEFGFTDSISGIDADPATGIIYGVNDTTAQLVQIDPVAQTLTDVAAYPDAAETDIDGLAVGNGFAYLVPDDNDPGLIYVYEFASGSFVTPLTAPWGATPDTFSGAGVINAAAAIPETTPVPVDHPLALALLLVVLLITGMVMVRRSM